MTLRDRATSHMETGEPSHSLLSQTAVPFETDDCESYFSQYEDYDHEQGDQCDPLDGPREPSELTEILTEDEQEGIEDYLLAFDSEESAGNEKLMRKVGDLRMFPYTVEHTSLWQSECC